MNKKIKTIALVAPCGNIKDKTALSEKIKLLEKNFKIKKFYNPDIQNNYLSDSDENRISYFEQAFLDKEVDLVLNIRGGFGGLKIVDKINYKSIKNSNKFYAGSSDATILLLALSKKTSIKCFHSLMLTNGFVENLSQNIEIIENDIFNLNLEKINSLTKTQKGTLWGGNLSTLVSALSDDCFLPDDDIILFLEDLNEPAYKIDKMLFELYRFKKLKEKLKAVIFGDFYLEDSEINPLILEYSEKFNIDCYKTKDITHKINNVTIPFAKKIELKQT